MAALALLVLLLRFHAVAPEGQGIPTDRLDGVDEALHGILHQIEKDKASEEGIQSADERIGQLRSALDGLAFRVETSRIALANAKRIREEADSAASFNLSILNWAKSTLLLLNIICLFLGTFMIRTCQGTRASKEVPTATAASKISSFKETEEVSDASKHQKGKAKTTLKKRTVAKESPQVTKESKEKKASS
mmetsp:Transcript_12879/g.17797  ORF Transcript_12879/g.17797 Transcript_12879/m.17797 type:complete len:192 (+) Transcript_12879:28-603(+)